MPRRAFRVCQHPGCGALCGGRFCDKHLAQPTSPAKQFDLARGSSAARGYDRWWRKLSALILHRDPICKIAKLCTSDYPGQLPAPSQCADHIKPRNQGGDNSPENLQGACYRCHNWKTRTQDSALARRDKSKSIVQDSTQGGGKG